jgi:hypothetical protein
MIVEMWISHRLKEAREFRLQAAKDYETYFKSVTNPNEVGSVGAQLVTAQAQVARMDKILVEADKFISENPTTIIQRRKIVASTNITTTYADIEASISGDRNAAEYTYTERERNVDVVRDPPSTGGGSRAKL